MVFKYGFILEWFYGILIYNSRILMWFLTCYDLASWYCGKIRGMLIVPVASHRWEWLLQGSVDPAAVVFPPRQRSHHRNQNHLSRLCSFYGFCCLLWPAAAGLAFSLDLYSEVLRSTRIFCPLSLCHCWWLLSTFHAKSTIWFNDDPTWWWFLKDGGFHHCGFQSSNGHP